MVKFKIETIPVSEMTSDPYGISSYEGYTSIPLVSSNDPNVLVISDENDEKYILGFVKKARLVSQIKHIKNYFYEGYGSVYNDIYNSIDDVDNLGISTKRSRDTVKGKSIYIGDVFVSGSSFPYEGFDSEFYLNVDVVASGTAPIGIDSSKEAYLVMTEGGGKHYLSTSGTVQEAEAYRINVGTRVTQMASHDVWTPATLKATSVEDAMSNIAGTLTKYGMREGFPLPNTYHVYNVDDDAGLFMGSGTVEVYKFGTSASEFSHTIWDDDGVHIDVDTARKINISVGGVTGTSIIIEDGKITLKGTDFEWTGNLHVTGTLDVDGKITGIGGADLT